VLAEEVGEIAHALNEHDDENLMEEIVQVAAVALAWLLSDFEYREIEYRYD
jgi:NTP pyrophosphatase (non-canonical NTP hydrolase)